MQDWVWYHIFVIMLNIVGLGFASFSEVYEFGFCGEFVCEL